MTDSYLYIAFIGAVYMARASLSRLQFMTDLRVQAEETVKASLGQSHTLPSLEDALESMRLVPGIYGEGLGCGVSNFSAHARGHA